MQKSRLEEMWEVVDQYLLKFDCEIPNSFLCVLCKQILRNAKQIPCGCRLCSRCLDTYINTSDSFCPGDSEDCPQQKFSSDMVAQDDNFANKEISKLMMKCTSIGCDVRDCVKNMCEHIVSCELAVIECEQCGQFLQRNIMAEHLKSNCPDSLIQCLYCNQEVNRKLMDTEHLNVENDSICDVYECLCPFECGLNEPVRIKEHIRVCINRQVSCPYRELGCCSESVPRNTMEGHLCQEGYSHASALLETISNLSNEVNRMSSTVNDGNERIVQLEESVARLRTENRDIRQNFTNQRNVVGGSIEDIRSIIGNLSRRLDFFDMKYEKRCFEYVWRIPNFKVLLTQSKCDWSKHVLSDQFFTSKNGYRMQMLLYANGLGDARGRFMSLYYQLLPGKFDDILPWPFMQNVEIRLLDQGGSNDHVVHIFYDPSDQLMADNYQRPPIDNTVPLFGCPRFVSKESLSQVPTLKKNDTLFIQFSATPVNLTE